MEIKVILGDITDCKTDAIVNAANSELRWGSGVCGAIFNKAGGEALQKECKKKAPVECGCAAITSGYNLDAKYVIHAVGPKYYENSKEDNIRLLASAYTSSLKLADEYNLCSIAFPSISTGVYGYPKIEAAKVALKAIKDYTPKTIQLVLIVCFDKETYDIYMNNI